MEFLSGLATVLLTMVGYSSGAVLADKDTSPAPKLLDVGVVIVLWILALSTQATLGRWVAIGVWFIVGAAAAFALAVARGGRRSAKRKATESGAERGLLRRIWHAWKRFSRRLGNYQGRLFLTLFYFLVITPFGALVRLFSDPLQIRSNTAPSFWVGRAEDSPHLDEARRQF